MLLQAQDLHPSRMDCLAMNYIGAFFSTYLPGATGGDFVKAYYVARDSHKKAEAVTTVFLDRVFGLYCMIGYGAVAILCRLGYLWRYGEPQGSGLTQSQFLVVLVFATFLVSTVGLAVLLSSHCRRFTHFVLGHVPATAGGVLKRVYEAVYLYRGHKWVLVKFAAYSVTAHSLAAVATFFVGLALGDPVACGGTRALNYLFLIPLGLTINGLPVTPAGLGAFEAACDWLFKTVGSPMGANVAALGHVVFILTNQLGLFFYVRGKKRVAEAIHEAEAQAPPELPHDASA
jgi:hypothetical protein